MAKKRIFGLDPKKLDKILSIGTEEVDGSDIEDKKSLTAEEDTPSKKSDAPNATASLGMFAEQPGGQIGRYKLLSILGEGGMGIVYLAEQKHPIRRQVAVKVIKPGMDSKRVIARFEAERQALALLDHPNIAHVHDAGTTENGRPYFVMEYVKGLSITEHCDHHKLTIEDRLNLFRQVCLAVHHAHQKGIIHRDIKPSNILVSIQDDKPVPKIIDFGVAKALAQPLTERTLATEDSQLLGTPEYMSPEQADMANVDIDTRSDIYSLGVLLYVLLTGVLPFDSTTFREGGIEHIRRVIRETDPKTPSTRLTSLGEEAKKVAQSRGTEIATLAKKLHKELEWIPLKAMRKDRVERYRSAFEFADDIDNYLKSDPLIAGPLTVSYRFNKFVRRNKAVLAGVTTVVVALMIGLTISVISLVREQRARRLAVVIQEKEARMRQEAEADKLAMRQTAYASDMNLAQQALAMNNLGRAQDLLNRHRPEAGEIDLRGWEWRYLWRQCQSDALFTLCRRPRSIWSLAVSHDGKWLAIGEDEGGGLSIWDLAARQEIARLAAGDGDVRVAFSPREPLLAFSVVTGFKSPSPQYSIRLWNETTKQIVAQFVLGGECMGLAFSDDGQNLVTYAGDPGNQITLWRVPTASKLVSYPVSPFNQMGTLAGTHFAMMCDMSVAVIAPDDTIHVIDLSTGEERWKAQAADELVKALAMSPDGKIMASGAGFAESAIRIWDMATGREITRLQDHRAWIGALAFWPDGKTLASVSADQTIRLWDLTDVTNVPPPRILRGHSIEVWRLGLLPDSRTLVSGCKDGSVCLWDTSTIQHEQMPIILPANVATWQFDPDNRSVLVLDSEGHLIRWKGPDYQDREWLMDIGTGHGLSGLISRDGRQVAAGSADGTIRLWSLQDRRLLHESVISTGQVAPLKFTTQGEKLAILHTNDSSVHEWDLTTWQETCLWQGAAYQRPSVAFSKDGRWSLVVGWDGASSLRDIVTGRQTNQQLDVREVDNATLSPDGRLFAVASSLGFFRLWETDTLQKSMTGRGFLMGVHSVAFSPDGKRLLTGSVASEAVKLWDVASCQELLTLEGQGSLFLPSAFSQDGNAIGSLNRQGDLHLWRAPSWAEIEAAEKSL